MVHVGICKNCWKIFKGTLLMVNSELDRYLLTFSRKRLSKRLTKLTVLVMYLKICYKTYYLRLVHKGN